MARAASSTPSMCALHRIADIAQHAALRRQTALFESPSLLSSLLSRGPKGPPPFLSDGELNNLVSLVGSVSAADLGVLREDFSGDGRDIGFIPVAETEDVTMAVFVLPPGSSLPLHDHVGMFVVSQVLFGRLKVREYDLLPTKSTTDGMKGRVEMRRATSYTESGETRTLTPTKGNIHSFHADEWTAVFDVLMPPYDAEEGRDCKYYETMPLEEGKGKNSPRTKNAQDKVMLQVSYLFCFHVPRQQSALLAQKLRG